MANPSKPNWSADRIVRAYVKLRTEVERMPPHEDRDEALSLLDRARVQLRGLIRPDVQRDVLLSLSAPDALTWEGASNG